MSIQSTQYAGLLASPKVKARPQDCGASEKVTFYSTPTTYAAQAVNETFDMGVIPAGVRIGPFAKLDCAAGAASSTLSIGLRPKSTASLVAAAPTAIASGVNLTAAGVKDANNGTVFGNGLGYITPEEMILYGTFTGATSTANQPIALYVPMLPPSP